MLPEDLVRKSLLVALFMLLCACANPESASAQSAAGIAKMAAPSETAAIPDPGDAAVAGFKPPAPPSDTSAPAAAKLALDGEGLRSFAISNGSSRLIAFGTKQDEAMRALETVQGMPPSDRGENVDCAAGYAAWPNGLTAWFARGEFVGWSVGSASSTMTTASSLKVGSPREELEAAYDARIAPSTLGTEFTAGGIAGLLDSANAGARVTDLWAGATCIAR